MPVKFQGNFAVLPRKEYEELKALAEEAFEDRETARIVDQEMKKVAAGMPVFPLEVVNRLINGENAIRVLRKWRDMTQEELSVSVGIPQGYLSDLETGKRKGPLELHRKFAKAFGVPLDVLAGEAVLEEKADPSRFANRRKAIADMKRTRSQR